MTKTYTVRDSQGRAYFDRTNRREAEADAKAGVVKLGGCFVVTAGDQIVTLAEKVGSKVDVRRLA